MAMSLKCSILGHSYGESDIERSREEDGSEVITTIREIETCQRCGEQRVVSENKEVTTLETAADIVAEDLGESTADDQREESSEAASPASESTDTATQEASRAEPSDDAGATVQSGPSGAAVQDPGTDDAEILDAETGEPTAESDESSSEETAQGGVDSASEETTPTAEDDDGVILDEESESDDREPGEWPDEGDEDDDDWEPETNPTPEEATIEPTGSAVTVPEGEFHCPECDFTTPVEDSSLRAGDFCPECHHGSLEHTAE
jgi:ssDNA-binding Zn-finger/Zn-ribbon topoisomerase 1